MLRRTLQADKKIVLGMALGIVVVLVLIQFWPLALTNPPPVSEPAWDSPRTREIAERACFDCHSNETVWPWYSRIVPFGNLLEKDVHEGRAVLNFSEWEQTCCTQEQIDQMAEVVNTGEMPLPYYIILHPEADLTSIERGDLVNGLIEIMNEEFDND
jgi:hypothetical protein